MKIIDKFIVFIALWSIAIFNEFFAAILAEKLHTTNSVIFLIGVMVLSIVIFIFLHYRKKLSVDIQTEVLKEKFQLEENAQRGLLLILSPFTPFGELAKLKNENTVEYESAIKNMDLEVLKLEDTSRSNFGHTVTALKSHKTKLEHVWLICTRSKSGTNVQSITYAPLIEKFIKEKINHKIQVHYDHKYNVLLDDDSAVCHTAFKVVKKIYSEAKKMGIKSEEIITDTTGGSKYISTGVILACMNKDENIQLIGSSYDDDGKLKGEPYPIIIKYKPFLFENN